MNEPVKVSVVVTTFNAERFIDAALESIAAQEYPPHEIIVCDDGSSDSTVARATAWRERLEPTPLRVLTHPNGGLSANRNRGILAAQGDVVAFLDVDDLYNPDHLATLAPAFGIFPELLLAFANMEHFGDAGTNGLTLGSLQEDLLAYSRPSGLPGLHRGDVRVREHWLRKRRISPSSWLVRRTAFARIGLFDPRLRYAEDFAFLFLALAAGDFVWCERPTTAKRTHGAQATSAANALRNEAHVIRALALVRALSPDLTATEARGIEAEIDQAAESLAYLASRQGLREYLAQRRRTIRYAGRRTPLYVRYLARAVLRSLGGGTPRPANR